MTKKIYLETFEKCAGSLCFTLLTTDKINASVIIFWIVGDMNLRETLLPSKLNIGFLKINVNDIVLVFYENVPRHLWRISMVTPVLPSRDSEIRGGIVRIAKTNTFLKRLVNKVFAVENTYHDTNQTD